MNGGHLLSRCCAYVVAGVRHADDIRRPIAAAVAGGVHHRRSGALHRRLRAVPHHPRLQRFDRLSRHSESLSLCAWGRSGPGDQESGLPKFPTSIGMTVEIFFQIP